MTPGQNLALALGLDTDAIKEIDSAIADLRGILSSGTPNAALMAQHAIDRAHLARNHMSSAVAALEAAKTLARSATLHSGHPLTSS